jgi:hypothetical protein
MTRSRDHGLADSFIFFLASLSWLMFKKQNLSVTRILLATLVCLLAGTPAMAAFSPVSFGLVPPIQFPPSEFTITGVRASVLWGEHRGMYGIDVGVLGNITDLNFVGVAVSGGFNLTRGTTTVIGLQAAGGANINTNMTQIFGLQVALGLNINEAASSVSGLQIAGLANLSPFTNIYGIQAGLYNRAQDVYGLQIGLVNVATNLHGVQLGLMNFNQKGLFSVSPILNIGF